MKNPFIKGIVRKVEKVAEEEEKANNYLKRNQSRVLRRK